MSWLSVHRDLSYAFISHEEKIMRQLIIIFVVAAGLAAPSLAAPCKDAKGKFMKCPPVATAPSARCRTAKGAFAKCGTPGAKPA